MGNFPNGWQLALRLARRELRGGVRGFRIMLVCLTLGVAAIAGVGSLSQAVVEGLHADGRKLLGGDVDLLRVQTPPPDERLAWLDANVRARSAVVETRAMAGNEQGDFKLTELKAVDAAYPLVGEVTLDPPMPLAQALRFDDGRWGTVIERGLMERLGLALGDRIDVGEARLQIRAVITAEPDRVATVVNFGPRLMIADGALPATELIRPGSQIRYHQRLLLAPGTDARAFIERLEAAFPDAGWRARDASRAAPQVERFIDRFTLFLSFVGLTSLLVGGVGVGNATAAYLGRKARVIATLKCLGAPAGLVFRVYLAQVGALAAAGIGAGLVIGAVGPMLVLGLLEGVLPVRAVAGLYPAPLILAALFGVLIALTFALWPLMRARRIPAAHLFRDRIGLNEPPDRAAVIAVGLSALALAAVAVLTASERGFAVWFVAGTMAALGLLRLGAWAVMGLARQRQGTARSASMRLGVGNLHRPGNRTAAVMQSLGLGLGVLVAVAQIEGNLNHQVSERLPAEAPAFFFVDIQSDQVAAFDAALSAVEGVRELSRVPSLRGRIVRIDGVPVDQVEVASDVQWAVQGDRALTYAVRPAEDAVIVAGSWWPEDYAGPPLISLDSRVAQGFGVGIGDTLTLNVLGRDITAAIASLRAIDWRSLQFDFAIIMSPGVLEAAPHAHIAAVKADIAAEDLIERTIGRLFTNVSTIKVRDALDAVRLMVEGIGDAVRSAAAITLLAGTLVLAGAIAAGHERRVYDAVVFKVLGATRRAVTRAYLVEYGLLGLATGVIGAAVGTLTSWAVMEFLMRSPWVFLPHTTALVVAGCLTLTLAGGLFGTWRALGRKAAPLLRNP